MSDSSMELPEELMTSILSKLPAKSLLRFKCVQKSWYSLINSPQFAQLHRSSIKKKNDCFLVRRFHPEQNLLSFHLERNVLSFHSYETLDDLGDEINILSLGAVLSGSCDGLVCLSNYDNQILICNPTIREFRSLFVPRTLRNKPHYLIESVALGSDPNTGKYSVLLIGVPYDYLDADYGDREARLYDFSTDSWKEVAFPPGPTRYGLSAVSLNGAFHCCPLDRDSKDIVTFHMTNEVTAFIPLPDFVVGVYLKKHLCVSSKSQISLVLHDYLEGWLEICVMTEYGVKESWTRLFKIGPLQLDFNRPIVFWDEQWLLLKNAQGQLVSTDLQHHQNLRHFPIDGLFDLCPYSQSLVSIKGIGHPVL